MTFLITIIIDDIFNFFMLFFSGIFGIGLSGWNASFLSSLSPAFLFLFFDLLGNFLKKVFGGLLEELLKKLLVRLRFFDLWLSL